MKKEEIETATAAVQLVDAIVGASITVLIFAGSVWLYRKMGQQFAEMREAYEGGATVGEILHERVQLPEDERRALHRDIRKLEGREGETDQG